MHLQGCPQLQSIKLINLTNNRAVNRLIHVNDAFLAVLAKSSGSNLTELFIGGCLGGWALLLSCDKLPCQG